MARVLDVVVSSPQIPTAGPAAERIWKRAAIKVFYRQNALLFVREDTIADNPEFQEALGDSNDLMLVTHSILKAQLGFGLILKKLPRSVWEFAGRRLQRLRS